MHGLITLLLQAIITQHVIKVTVEPVYSGNRVK